MRFERKKKYVLSKESIYKRGFLPKWKKKIERNFSFKILDCEFHCKHILIYKTT